MKRFLLAALTLGWVFVHSGFARQAPPAEALPVVVDSNGTAVTTTHAELGDTITVAMTGLQGMATAGKKPDDLRLYLAGLMLTMNSPTLVSFRDGYANFRLEIDPADRTAWVSILASARRASGGRIPLTVGLKDLKQPFESKQELDLQVYPNYTALIAGFVAALFIVMIVLGNRSDLLRDTTNPPPSPARAAFSFGRVQMAFWFGLVIAAFLYVWMITGEYNTLTNSVLALIGISAGTGLAAVFVDRQKIQDIQNQRVDLETRQTALNSRIAELTAVAPAPGTTLDQELQQKKNEVLEVQASLAHLPALPPPHVSSGFWKDILRSGEGMTFHRFQMAVWTLVLGIIFVRSVFSELAMPEFDTSLLGLMGISSGTYIGFKFPEKPK